MGTSRESRDDTAVALPNHLTPKASVSSRENNSDVYVNAQGINCVLRIAEIRNEQQPWQLGQHNRNHNVEQFYVVLGTVPRHMTLAMGPLVDIMLQLFPSPAVISPIGSTITAVWLSRSTFREREVQREEDKEREKKERGKKKREGKKERGKKRGGKRDGKRKKKGMKKKGKRKKTRKKNEKKKKKKEKEDKKRKEKKRKKREKKRENMRKQKKKRRKKRKKKEQRKKR